MAILPQRQYGILITVGLAVVAAAIAGVVLFTSSRATEVDLTTAKLVPEDAGIYVALNTDLASSQWVAAFKLIERLGTENPEDKLRDSAEDGGVDWEKDVAPFLGGNAAVYLRGFSISSLSVQGAAIARCKDAKRALEVVMDESGFDFERETHRGVEYFNGGGLVVARVGNHLVVAMDVESMEEVIDVSEGKTPSLASVADFKSLRDELTNNFLAFVYVNAGALSEGLFGGDAELRAALEKSGAGDLALKPGAAVIGAKDEGFEFQAASVGKPGLVSPMLQPRKRKFAAMVPADAAIFFSTTNIAQTWKEIRARSEGELDDFFRQQSGYRDLDDALRSAGQEIGLKNVEELINLFTGEMSVAAWFTSTDEEDAEVALLADVQDEANARRVLDAVAGSSSSSRPRNERVDGVEMTFVKDSDGRELGYAVKDGYMVFGTARAARSVIARDFGPDLAGAPNYQKSVKQMPTALGTFAYFDLATLLRLTAGGVPVDLDEAEKALRGTIFNMVDERGVVRVSGVVTIAEK
ncbi:MAG: hypothetical protein C0506_05420 [Anaerolinea sp.]|nr:hypothetical protein [Anaerolinea sp.]